MNNFLTRSNTVFCKPFLNHFIAENACRFPGVVQLQSIRFMSKYLSKSAAKRLPLNTKRAGKGYKKGKGATKEGRLTSKGRFIVDPLRRLELVVPENLKEFKLKPYIAKTVPRFPPELRSVP